MGLPWLVLALPLAIAVQIFWNGVSNSLRNIPKPQLGFDTLKTHQESLSQALNDLEDAPPALKTNLKRLDTLVEKAQQFFDQTI